MDFDHDLIFLADLHRHNGSSASHLKCVAMPSLGLKLLLLRKQLMLNRLTAYFIWRG